MQRVLTFAVALLTFGPAHAGEEGAARGINPATVAAYGKLGAVYGAMDREYSSYFREGRAAAEKGVPAFFFRSAPRGALLPAAAPFGLVLRGGVTDEILVRSELTALKDLVALDLLGAAGVTDAGLKELAGLTNLASLNLWNTNVTDRGLKHLSRLTALRSLNLRATKVTDAGMKELAGLKKLTELNQGERITHHPVCWMQ